MRMSNAGKSKLPIKVETDLAWLRGTITVPIWVIALK